MQARARTESPHDRPRSSHRFRALPIVLAGLCAGWLLHPASVVAADGTGAPAPGGPGPTTAPAAVPQSGITTGLPEVVVTANRIPTPPSEIGSSVTVITSDDIQRQQVPFVADALRGVPSVDIVRSGGPGQITSIFTRGSNSDHTLVLIDGIEANDPTSPTRAFDFSTLTVDDIDRIEVIRGPQSTLWGSNAIGGVVNIISRRGQGPPTGYLYTEDGSFNTFREGAGVSGGNKAFNYSLSLSQADSQGISAADSKFGNREPDGYDNSAVAGKFGLNVSENFDIDFIARYQHSQVDIDDHGGPGGDDPNRELRSNEAFFRIQPRLALFEGKWIQTYGLNYTYYDRQDTDPGSPTKVDGGITKLDWQNDIELAKNDTVTAGVVLGRENLNATGTPHEAEDTTAVYLQDAINFWKRLYLTGGVRYEYLSITGSDTTYRFTGAYLFPTHTTVRASYGTGFKAPTLFDLFSSFGFRGLQPEKSNGWDAGVEQGFFKDRLILQGTYFSNHFRDLFDFNFTTNREDNVGRAESQGVELGLSLRPTDHLTLGVNYTYTDTKDLTTGLPLLRRPFNSVGAQITWDYSKKGQITAGTNYESSRSDIDPITFNRTRVPGYIVVNLSTAYKLTEHATVTARIANLFNEHYEEVAGFGEPGFSMYGGLKLTF